MSGVSELGIRVALVGGRAAALESLEVAKGIQAIGTESIRTGVEATKASIGMDMLGKSTKGLADSDIISWGALQKQQYGLEMNDVWTKKLVISTDELIASVNTTTTSITAETAKMTWFDRALMRTGINAEFATQRLMTYSKGVGVAFAVMAGYVAYESLKMATAYSGSTASIAANANISISAANSIGKAFLSTAFTTTSSAQEMDSAYASVAGQLSTVTGQAYTTSQSLRFMTVAGRLADASGQDLTSTTTSLASAMQVFHYTTSQAGTAANILYNTSRLTANSTSSLTSTMDHLHSQLLQVMPSLSDVSALTLDLADHGALGSKATYAVSSALNTLLSGSKSVTSELQVLGIKSTDLFGTNGKFIGMSKVIGMLQPQLARLAPEWQIMAEKQLFGARAAELMGATVLSGVGAYEKATAAITQHGVMAAAAAKQDASWAGVVKIVRAGLHDLGIIIGMWLEPKLAAFGNWLLKHKPVLIAFGILIGVVVVGAFALLTAALISAAIAAVTFEGAMTMGLSVLILAIVVGVTMIATHWRQLWTNIVNWGRDAINFVIRMFDNIYTAFQKIPGELLSIGKYIVDAIEFPFIEAFNFVLRMYNNTLGKLPSWLGGGHINYVHTTFAGGPGHATKKLPGFANGGVVPGVMGSPMMAIVHGGEIITPPDKIYNGHSASPSLLGMSVSGVLPSATSGAVIPSQVTANNPGGTGPTVIQLVVDRKVLAETVYQAISDTYARR
jgi:TP901 family phage tail tape measure protein